MTYHDDVPRSVLMVRYPDPFQPAQPFGWRSAFLDSQPGTNHLYGGQVFDYASDDDMVDNSPPHEGGYSMHLFSFARWAT